MSKIKNGQVVRDTVNGFKGKVTAITKYLNGCVQALVSPQTLDDDGDKRKSYWIDEGQLEVVKIDAAKEQLPTGGPPRSHPSSRRE